MIARAQNIDPVLMSVGPSNRGVMQDHIFDERGRHHTRCDDTTRIRRRADACDIVAVDIPDGPAGRLVTRSTCFTHNMLGPTAVAGLSPLAWTLDGGEDRFFGSLINTRLWAPRPGSRRIEIYTAAQHR